MNSSILVIFVNKLKGFHMLDIVGLSLFWTAPINTSVKLLLKTDLWKRVGKVSDFSNREIIAGMMCVIILLGGNENSKANSG